MASVRIMRVDSEDLPDGLVEAAGADGVDTVEDAPVLVRAVEDGAVDLVIRGRLLDSLFEEEAGGVGFLVEPIFGSDHLLAFGEPAAFEKLAVFGDGRPDCVRLYALEPCSGSLPAVFYTLPLPI